MAIGELPLKLLSVSKKFLSAKVCGKKRNSTSKKKNKTKHFMKHIFQVFFHANLEFISVKLFKGIFQVSLSQALKCTYAFIENVPQNF